MRPVRSFATGMTLLSVLGLTTVMAQRGAQTATGRRALDPKVVTVRLLLGVGDREPMDWSGKAAIDQGEVVGVEGWRFRQQDEVIGSNAWAARTRPSLKGAAKKALAKKKAAILKAPGGNV